MDDDSGFDFFEFFMGYALDNAEEDAWCFIADNPQYECHGAWLSDRFMEDVRAYFRGRLDRKISITVDLYKMAETQIDESQKEILVKAYADRLAVTLKKDPWERYKKKGNKKWKR